MAEKVQNCSKAGTPDDEISLDSRDAYTIDSVSILLLLVRYCQAQIRVIKILFHWHVNVSRI